MKKILLLLVLLLSLVIVQAQNNCPLRMKVTTAPGDCYNNSFIQIDLVNADGTPMDTNATDLSNFKFYCINTATDDTTYSYLNAFTMAPGTYIVGVQAVCHYSYEEVDSAYILLDTNTTVTTTTTYITPALSMINNVAGSKTAYGTGPTLPCMNTGRVQLKITGGKFPYYVAILDENEQPIDTVSFAAPMYSGTTVTNYNYKDYYTIDSLGAGKYFFYVWDECGYHLPKVWQTVPTAEAPYISNVCWYNTANGWADTKQIKHVFTITANGYYADAITEMVEYRYIYPEIDGVQDTTEWRHLSSNSTSDTLTTNVPRAHSYCDMWGKAIKIETRTTVCNAHRTIWPFTINKPTADIYTDTTWSSDSSKTVALTYDSCGYYDSRTQRFGHYNYRIEYRPYKYSIYSCETSASISSSASKFLTRSPYVYWVYSDTATHQIIKIDTIRYFSTYSKYYDQAYSYLRAADIVPIYGSFTDSAITIPVQRTLYDAQGCELYTRFDNLTFKNEITYTGGSRYTRTYDYAYGVQSTDGRSYLRLFENNTIPMRLNGNCTVELVSSPNDNFYNYKATFDQTTRQWTIEKKNLDNQAIITLDTNKIQARIADFCLPNGVYQYSITTNCDSSTLSCTTQVKTYAMTTKSSQTSDDYCCNKTRYIQFYETDPTNRPSSSSSTSAVTAIPLRYKGDCTVELEESPWDNQFNFKATYTQATGKWTITKASMANLATITASPYSIDFKISDYCLPSGQYKWRVSTPCDTSTHTQTVSFNSNREITVVQRPQYEFIPNCSEMNIKPVAGKYEMTYYNTNTSGTNINQPYSTTSDLAAQFQIISGPTGGYNTTNINLNGTTRITMPGTYVIRMYNSSYTGSCGAPVIYDTIRFTGGTVEYEYDYAYVCDSTSTTGFVRVKGKSGTEPYTYTLYSAPNLQGAVLGVNNTGIFDDVPLHDGQQVSVKIEDACLASFDISFFVFDLQKAQKCWFTDGVQVTEACEGSYVNVYVIGLEDEVRYQWTGPNGFSANTKNAQIFVPKGAVSGWYYVNIINSGCLLPIKDSVYLTVKRVADVAIAEDATICPGESVTLNFTTSGGVGDVHYTIAQEENSVITKRTYTNNDSFTYTPTSSGIFWVNDLYDDQCPYNIPFDTVTVTLNNHIATACDVIATPDTVCWDSNAVVYAFSTLATPYTLRWYEDYGQTNLLKEEVINSSTGRSQYDFLHLSQDTMLYVTVENAEFCETKFGTILSWMNMRDGSTELRCGESIRFYDAGGVTDYYPKNQSTIHTFTSTDGEPITLSFSKFYVESDVDKMLVFNGSTTDDDSLIATLSGYLNSNLPEDIVSEGSSLTVWFLSNGATQYTGWEATVSNNPKPTIAEAIVIDTIDVQLVPFTAIPVHYNGDVTMQAVADGGRHQLYQYEWQTSTDSIIWNTVATVSTTDTSRQTLTHLTEPTYVRVILTDKSVSACDGADTAVYFLPIGNIKLALQLDITQDYYCSPYYTGALTVRNSATALAENVTAKVLLPEGISFVAPTTADFNFGNIAGGESATLNFQVKSSLEPLSMTELMAKAQIWSCLQGDSVPTVVFGDWNWTGLPRQVDEDTAKINVLPTIPADLYQITVLNDTICYGGTAELVATSNLSGTLHFNWYEDATLDHYVGSDIVTTTGGRAQYYIPNVQQEKTYYVTVGTDDFCPTAGNWQPQTVSIKAPTGQEIITATDDNVCYDYTADLTASSDIAYPQYYTWWDKDQTTLLARDTITSGASHFRPEHQISDTLYYVHVYNDTTCPYIPDVHHADKNEWIGDFLMTPDKANKTTMLACGDSLNFYDEGGKTGNYSTHNQNYYHTFKAEAGKQVVLTLTSFAIETNYDYLYVYDGEDTSSTNLASLTGSSWTRRQYTSSNGSLTIRWKTDGRTVSSGWAGSFTNSCKKADLAEAHVSIKKPLGAEALTATNDTVCYDNTADLTASSDIAYPQYYTWWAKDQTTLLARDTITSGASHFRPEHQISGSLYYVHVYNDTTCPYIWEIYDLAEAHVSIKKPLGAEALTATNDTVCYDYTADLTATSSLTYPQYYTWWASDGTTLLSTDTINSAADKTHYRPEHQISDSLYYVHVYNDTTCPYIPDVHHVDKNEWIGDFLMTPDKANKTTMLACGESLNFYDEGGKTGNYSTHNQNYYHTFKAEAGNQVVLTLTSFASESSCDYLYVYDGENTSSTNLASLTGSSSTPGQYTSSNGSLTIRWKTDGSVVSSGWVGSITTSCKRDILAEAHVSIKKPLGAEALTATNDTVCYDYTADLTATSSLTYPQYYTWWASDATTLLQQDTINTAEEKTHYRPEHQISDSLYYVHVYDSLNCAYIPSLHARILLSEYKMNQTAKDTTFLSCGDSIPFYDHGGKNVKTTTSLMYYRIFKAEPGKQVTIHIDTLSLTDDSSYCLQIYDGESSSGTRLATLYGNKSNLTYTSTKGALYVIHHSFPGHMGWEGSVTTNCFDLAESHVSIRKPLGSVAVTATNDTVCYDYTADLTASSSLTYPQYYTWWASDGTTLLSTDTINSAADKTHYRPEHQISDSLYYVHVYDSLNCAYIPSLHARILLPEYKMNQTAMDTTFLSCGDSIPFYDHGGKKGNTTTWSTYYRIFKAEPGKQVTIHIDTLSLSSGLRIYDGEAESGTPLATLSGNKSNLTYTSTKGALYVIHYSYSGYMGWEGSVVVNCNTVDLAEAHVAIKAPLGAVALTATNDTVCYDYTADLTATSSLTYPQYYTWWDKDMTTLLARDTVTSGVSHFNPEHQISDSLYYVHVYDSLNCPLIPGFNVPMVSKILQSQILMNSTASGTSTSTTIVGALDSIPFYDNGGKNGNTTTYSTYYRIFKAEPGKQVTIHIDNLSLIDNSSYCLRIYDGESPSGTPLANLYGNKANLTYTSTKGALYVLHYSYSGYMGWEATVTTDYEEFDLAEAHVSIRKPLGSEALTATNDTVCYDYTADLTATSSLTYPQYYTWWANDGTTLLSRDTINTAEEKAHYRPEHQISDSLYYVHVYDSLNCPYIPSLHTRRILLPEYKMNKTTKDTTFLSCGDSIPFYDHGGKNGKTTTFSTYYRIFKAEPGKQVTIHIDTLSLIDNSSYYLKIYDGASETGTPMANLYGNKSNLTYTSTKGALYVRHYSYSGYMGWEGSVVVNCNTVDLAESHVSIKAPLGREALTTTNDTVCYDYTADLTASSDIAYPQYYTWWAKDQTTLLARDTITSGASHFRPEHQISDSLYYVHVYNDTTCPYIWEIYDLAEAHVSIKKPLGAEALTATNDTVCYDYTADLTATSSLTYPQYYTWWASDGTTLLSTDTINSAADKTHYRPEHQISDSLYYVHVYNSLNCAYIPSLHARILLPEYKMNQTTKDTTFLSCGDSIPFYDHGGKNGNTTTSSTYYRIFKAEPGKQVTIHIDTLSLSSSLRIYDGEAESGTPLANLYGNKANLTYTSTKGALYVIHYSYSGYMGWEGSVTTNCFDLAESHVSIRKPLGSVAVTATNDTVCYDYTADLTATSSLTYPQYYTWWASDATTLLQQDTINTAEEKTHYRPEHQISNSLYYVHVYDSVNCAYIPSLHARILLPEYKMNQTAKDTTFLSCGDSIPFYDHGGKYGNTTTRSTYYRIFKAEPGKQVTIHIDTLSLIYNSSYYLKIYDGEAESGTPLANLYGNKANLTYTSTKGALYVIHYSYSGYMGWKGSVVVNRNTVVDLAEAHVSIKAPLGREALTTTNDTVCYDYTADLTASSDIAYPQYYTWWDKDHTTLLARDTITSGVSHFNPEHQISDSPYYVHVYNDTTCPYIWEIYALAEAHVSIKVPTDQEIITATDDNVCYDYTADLTASSDIAYPQYYTWWDKDQTTLLARDTITSGASHFRPEHQISDSLYYVHVYNDTTCPYIPDVHHVGKNEWIGDFLMTPDKANKTTMLACGDSLNFYDEGGKTGNYSTHNQNYYHTFKAEAGNQVVLTLTSFASESSCDYLYVYDGENTSSTNLASLTGSSSTRRQYTSSNGSLTIRWKTDGSAVSSGWVGSITTSCKKADLAEAHVSIKKPLGAEALTATNDEVCYDNTANLTASSDIAYPQYYTWWAKDKTTLIGRDTIASGLSHFNPEHQINDSTYYVHVYNDTACPYLPALYKNYRELRPEYLLNRTTVDTTLVGCEDSIPFFDAGGENGNITAGNSTYYYRVLKAVPGSQIVLHIDTLNVYPNAAYALQIYDGKTRTGTPTQLYGAKHDVTITSTSGYLYLYQRSYSGYMGWKGYITTTCDNEFLAPAEATVIPVPVITLTTDLPSTDGACIHTEKTLSVAATSTESATVSYQWYKDDVAIDGAIASTYTVPDTLPAGVYQYKVMVDAITPSTGCSAVTVTSTVCAFTVSEPSITISTENTTICALSNTDLKAEVSSGAPDFSYLWSTNETTQTINVAPLANTTYEVTVTDANGCQASTSIEIIVKPTALGMDNLVDTIRCNGAAFSVTPTGTSIPAGTQYIWTVAANANVTGQSAQTTPVDAPISQMLVNNSDSKQTVVYTVTPVTGECVGEEFTITVTVFPKPGPSLICPDDITRTLEYGSCAVLIAPEDLGTPIWASELGLVLIDTTNNAPADNMYPEGDNIVRWIVTDECGNADTCEQHVIIIFPQCPDAVDYEGNVYHGVRIDCDCWTQRNLESHQYSDGSDIPGIYSYISDMYPDSAANAGTFGLLYDWESAIRDGQDNGHGHVQGICPEGWYLPTAEKYEALNLHGAAALKSPLYWLDGGGNNSTGFTSLPAGYYDGSIGRYLNLMGEAYYWSTTRVNGEIGSSSAVIRYTCNEVLIQETREGLGYSVRCIKEKE